MPAAAAGVAMPTRIRGRERQRSGNIQYTTCSWFSTVVADWSAKQTSTRQLQCMPARSGAARSNFGERT